MALQWEQHQELWVWPLPSTECEESIALDEFQALL